MTDSVTIAILAALAFSAAAAALHHATRPCTDYPGTAVECDAGMTSVGYQGHDEHGDETWVFVCECDRKEAGR